MTARPAGAGPAGAGRGPVLTPPEEAGPGAPQPGAAQPEAAPGRVRLSDTMVSKLAARAAVEVSAVSPTAPGLIRRTMAGAGRWGTGQSSLADLPRTSAEVEGGRAFIAMTISVRWPAPVPSVTATLREHLRERIHELTGLTVSEVRITVAALDAEAPSGRRVR